MENVLFLENTDKKKKSIGLIHKVYLSMLKNARVHTASTKTRSEVRGGGRKPWRQKGTGNARAGSTRSPLFVGGGIIFGPRPRKVTKKINKKEKRLAILSAFYLKKNDFLFFNDTAFSSFQLNNEKENNSTFPGKTKLLVKLLTELGAKLNKKTLLIVPSSNRVLWLASRNIKNLEIVTANCLNLNQLLHNHSILLSNSSLEIINSLYGKQYA